MTPSASDITQCLETLYAALMKYAPVAAEPERWVAEPFLYFDYEDYLVAQSLRFRLAPEPPARSSHEKLTRHAAREVILEQAIEFYKLTTAFCPALGCPYAGVKLSFKIAHKEPFIYGSLQTRSRQIIGHATTAEEFTNQLSKFTKKLEGYTPGENEYLVRAATYTGAAPEDALHAWAVIEHDAFLDADRISDFDPPTISLSVSPFKAQDALKARLVANRAARHSLSP